MYSCRRKCNNNRDENKNNSLEENLNVTGDKFAFTYGSTDRNSDEYVHTFGEECVRISTLRKTVTAKAG